MIRKTFEIKRTLTVYEQVTKEELKTLLELMDCTDTMCISPSDGLVRVELTSEEKSETLTEWEEV